MKPLTACCTVAAGVCLFAGLDARQATFRAGVDLVEIDVSVLDKDRHPVHGLTAGDFTVTIDNQPRRVASFKEIDIPPAAPGPMLASWTRDVAPDVATN